MGSGNWTSCAYERKIRTMGFDSSSDMAKSAVRQIYRQNRLADELNPHGVIRQCKDSEEHPNTFSIILGLDVTGSMGKATTMCAAKLNDIMTELYSKVKDVEFMMMGIGDLAYDQAPLQVTQFESDIRILDQTSKIWFEGGGGGNCYESYTVAWYFGTYNTDLDCWNRNKKGLIITMGDEPLNPYLPKERLDEILGDDPKRTDEEGLSTENLYRTACGYFDIYHIAITDRESSYRRFEDRINESWGKLLGQNLMKGTSEDLPRIIGAIVDQHMAKDQSLIGPDGFIRW